MQMLTMDLDMKYSADITAGSLKLRESRIVAGLLLGDIRGSEWRRAIVDQNVLQSRNPRTAVRIARLIRQRLELMKSDLWRLVRDGSSTVSIHALFAAAIKHSPLLGDFLDLVVWEQFRVFNMTLPKKLFDEFIHDCRGRDPEMPQFNESTCRKLQTTVYHILVQAGYLVDTKSLKLQNIFIAEPVLDYLQRNHEDYVLRCIRMDL